MYLQQLLVPSLKPSLPVKSQLSTASSSSQTSRSSNLLFGEIPLTPATTVDGRSTRSHGAICNLLLSTSSAFLRFWLNDNCRDSLLSQTDREDLPNVRLVCHDFSTRAAPYLFEDVTVTFKPSSFTKAARIDALERIGRHVKTFTFHMPHSRDTFLAPIIDPQTGEEKPFLYVPQVETPTTLLGKTRLPKYGTMEMTELLMQQYPPLFHAATNVPAFIRAFSELTALTHLRISCPGYEDTLRGHRRSTVDYALISLCLAVERAPLYALNTLSLLPIYPGGLLYLHPMLGFSSFAVSIKRWSQIRRLAIHMESFPPRSKQSIEHLRILHTYLNTLSQRLTRLFFCWKGERGPSPLSLDQEPCMQLRRPSEDHLHPSMRTNQLQIAGLQPLKFCRLRVMELENAIMDGSQISSFIHMHQRSLTEFNFENVKLRSGDWDLALEPLTAITGSEAGSEAWKNKVEEVMDVPIMLSSVDVLSRSRVLAPLVPEELHGARPPPRHGNRATPPLNRLGEADFIQKEKGAAMTGTSLSRWISKAKRDHAAKEREMREQVWGSGGNSRRRRLLAVGAFSWWS